jgi:spore cortex biosynthesis protein YabQ
LEVTLAAQSQGLLVSCIVGFILGAVYDVFRVLRILFKSEKRHVFFQDLFFMAFAAVVTFLLALAVNWGEMRFYILAGEIIGICVYFLTVGEVTIRIAKLVYKVLYAVMKFIKKWLILPVARLFLRFGRFLSTKFFKFIKYLKKISSNRKKALKPHNKVVYNQPNRPCTNKGRKKGRRHFLRDESYQEKKAKR